MVCILRGCVAPNWTMARELMSSMTFKLELMLMDPTKIKPVLVKRVLRILNTNHKNLTPVNLLSIDQGASILLTWVINFIKWHTGCIKYNFRDANQGNLGGTEALSNQGGLLANMDGSITNNDDFMSHHQRIPGANLQEEDAAPLDSTQAGGDKQEAQAENQRQEAAQSHQDGSKESLAQSKD